MSESSNNSNNPINLNRTPLKNPPNEHDENLRALVKSFNQAANTISRSQKITQMELIAVDFETTGLTPSDQIISMGFCPITQLTITLKNCKHFLVNANTSPSEKSITIHGITHDDISRGVSPEIALREFLLHCQGKVIVAHFHKIERQFIQSLAHELTGQHLKLNILDTFQIAKVSMERRQQAVTPNSLRLFNLRKAYHLPFYNAHNALEDAISTAELLLAQISATNLQASTISLKDLNLLKVER